MAPSAEPLRVERASGELRLSWEDVAADGFLAYEGDLDALREAGYSHAVVSEPAATPATVPSTAGNRYYLVGAACVGPDGSLGRDSNGEERPRGRVVRLTIGLQGGMAVFGARAAILHPVDTFIEDAQVEFVGPFAPDSPGMPLLVPATVPEGRAEAAATFTVFDPDPSFDPPASGSVDVFRLTFDHDGPAPDEVDFVLDVCDVRDAFGQPVPATSCLISSFEVVP